MAELALVAGLGRLGSVDEAGLALAATAALYLLADVHDLERRNPDIDLDRFSDRSLAVVVLFINPLCNETVRMFRAVSDRY